MSTRQEEPVLEEREHVVQLSRLQVFAYLFVVPLLFTIVLTVVLGSALSIFDFSPQLNGAQMWLHRLPLVGAWIPEPAPVLSDMDAMAQMREEIRQEWDLIDKIKAEQDERARVLTANESALADLLLSYNKQREETERRDKRIANLVAAYEQMKPDEAARIFNTTALDDETCVEILLNMDIAKSAKLMAAMDPERAGHLSVLIRR